MPSERSVRPSEGEWRCPFMALSVVSLRCEFWSAIGAYRTSSSNQVGHRVAIKLDLWGPRSSHLAKRAEPDGWAEGSRPVSKTPPA